jgi:hypothetical protein
MKHLLIFPMAAYVVYIWCLAVLNFIVRRRAVRAGQMHWKFFKTFTGDSIPERIIVVGRHFDNQFQLPMLFLITCCLHMIVDKVDHLTLLLAWLFVVTRFFHSLIHLGHNRILPRAMSYAAGWLMILLLWGQLIYVS